MPHALELVAGSFWLSIAAAALAAGTIRALGVRAPARLRPLVRDPVPFCAIVFAATSFWLGIPEFPPLVGWRVSLWWLAALGGVSIALRISDACLRRGSAHGAVRRAGHPFQLYVAVWLSAGLALALQLLRLYEAQLVAGVVAAFVCWGGLADVNAARAARSARVATFADGIAPLAATACVAYASGSLGISATATIAAAVLAVHLLPPREPAQVPIARSAALALAGLLTVAAYAFAAGLTAVPPACFVLVLLGPPVGALIERALGAIGRPRTAATMGVAAQLATIAAGAIWAQLRWQQLRGEF